MSLPTPIKDQVIVRQDPKKERLSSGLYVPQSADHALWDNYGEVLAVGPGRTELGEYVRALDVKVGDRVLFKRSPGTALMPDRREIGILDQGREDWADVLVLREDDIIGVVESED